MSEASVRGGARRGVIVLMALLALATVEPADASGQIPAACRDIEPWAAGLAERSLSYGALGRFASTWQGAPISCEGSGDTEFDGRRFGSVEVGFRNGLVFGVQTFPPEGSVTRLTLEDGFDHAELVLAAARDHAEGFGLRVDWSLPELSEEDGLRVETYWDPEPGLNASVSFLRDGTRLVGVRITAAP